MMKDFAITQRHRDLTHDRLRSDDDAERRKGVAQLVARERFAWPGGYALFAVTNDGALLCPNCIRSEYPQVAAANRNDDPDGWRTDGFTHAGEMEDDIMDDCAHCGRPVLTF